MIVLPENEYDKVKKPLAEITVNNLFARAVVEKRISGAVYADEAENPQTFYVAHPYGLSMLFGEAGNDSFNSGLVDYMLNISGRRVRTEQLLVFPDNWHKKITELFDNRLLKSRDHDFECNGVKEGVRINFKFNSQKYRSLKKLYPGEPAKIVRTKQDLFDKIKGSVIPKYFWRDADHFCLDGIGYTAIEEDEPASTAFSAFIQDRQLEIGIETADKFRGRKFALSVCATLVDYCLENNYEPVWACRADNAGSYRLALKLGFEPVLAIPYYHLPTCE